MIFIAYCRLLGKIITMHKRVHIGFLCAVWYWHFVDVVWLFVWFFIYCWGQL
jgi:cytochrome c oxidase subunit 3